MNYESDVLFGIDPEYPLVAGDWDICIKNKETKEKSNIRVRLIKTTLVKDLSLINDHICFAAKRVR